MISNKAHDLVSKLASALEDPIPVLSTPELLLELETVGSTLFADAVVKALAVSSGRVRVSLASLILCLDSDFESGMFTDGQVSEAEAIRSEALNEVGLEHSTLQTFAFTHPPSPTQAQAIVRHATSSSNELRLLALVALARFFAVTEESQTGHVEISPLAVESALRSFLSPNNDFSAIGAAAGLGFMNVADDSVIDLLIGIVDICESELALHSALWALGKCGKGSRKAQEYLCARIQRPGPSAMIDFITGHSLGQSMTVETFVTVFAEPLNMNTDHWSGVLVGISSTCLEDPEFFEECAGAIDSDDSTLRFIAVQSFSFDKKCAVRASPLLLSRVGIEDDMTTIDVLAHGLALAGEAVVDDLVNKMLSGNTLAMVTSGLALSKMGVKGVRALVSAARDCQDLHVQASLIAIVRDMGPAKASVATELGDLLANPKNSGVRYFILKALASLGGDAEPATAQVICALFDEDPEVRKEAEATIRATGPGALPHLERAMADSLPEQRERLSTLQGWDYSYDIEMRPKLLEFSADELLGFLHIADCLRDGRIMSFSSMAKTPLHEELRHRLKHQVNRPWLNRVCQRLCEGATGGHAITSSSTSGSSLTRRGRRLESQIRRHLHEMGLIERFRPA